MFKSIKILLVIFIASSLIIAGCGSDKSKSTDKPIKVTEPVKEKDTKKDEEEVKLLNYATVVSMKGDVLFSKNEKLALEKWKRIRLNQRISKGDWILTKEESSCILQVGSENKFFVDPNTRINVNTLIVEKDKIKDASLTLKMGKLLARPKGLSQGSSFSVRTPSAVAGVRGTEFIVLYDGKAQKSEIAVSEGKVAVVRDISLPKADVKIPEIKNFAEALGRGVTVNADQKIIISKAENKALTNAYSQAVKNKKIDKATIDKATPKINKLTADDRKEFAEKKKMIDEAKINLKKDETEKLAKEKAEKEKLAKEKAEKEKLAKEKAEKEKLAKEKAEKEKLAKEKAEKEKLAKEKAEKEKLAKEKAEKEKKAIVKDKPKPRKVYRAPVRQKTPAVYSSPIKVKGYKERRDLGRTYKQSYVGQDEKKAAKKENYVIPKKSRNLFDINVPKSSDADSSSKIEDKKYLDLEPAQIEDIKELEK